MKQVNKYFVFSDVHGCFKELKKSLEKAGFDETNPHHILISCGDMFDRGEESLAVYKYLKDMNDKGRAICLKGNHEPFTIEYLNGSSITPFNWQYNGTNTTLDDFLHRTDAFHSWCMIDQNIEKPTWNDFSNWLKIARDEINKEYPELLDWLTNLPWYYETEHYIFTHASVDTSASDWRNPKYGWYEFTWDNGSFIKKDTSNIDKTIVVGHFHCRDLRMQNNINDGENEDAILRVDNKIFLDTCTILSRKVNVLVIEDEKSIDID